METEQRIPMPRIAMPGGSEPKPVPRPELSNEEILAAIDKAEKKMNESMPAEPLSAAEQIAAKREEMARKRVERAAGEDTIEKS